MEFRRFHLTDVPQMIRLQGQNLRWKLAAEECNDGFLMTEFSASDFMEMDQGLGIVVAEEQGVICGYLCMSLPAFFQKFPLQAALMARCQHLWHESRPLTSYKYLLANPICIAKPYRGVGVYLGLCEKALELIPSEYELALGLMSPENKRHLNAIKQAKMESVGNFEVEGHSYLIFARFLKENGKL